MPVLAGRSRDSVLNGPPTQGPSFLERWAMLCNACSAGSVSSAGQTLTDPPAPALFLLDTFLGSPSPHAAVVPPVQESTLQPGASFDQDSRKESEHVAGSLLPTRIWLNFCFLFSGLDVSNGFRALFPQLIGINQLSSNLGVHQHHLGGLSHIPVPIQWRFLYVGQGWGPGTCISTKHPPDTEAAGPGLTRWEPLVWSVVSLKKNPTNLNIYQEYCSVYICWTLLMLDIVTHMSFYFWLIEIKEELEDLNKEIKKTANKIRTKLKCELRL